MSIQPPSDIVLDVAQAADPVKSLAATQRLTRMAAPNGTSAEFSNVLENAAVPLDHTSNLRSQLGLTSGSRILAKTDPADPRTKAFKGLEALIFQNLFETTLPHDESLGAGMAGDVWRSMMAEQLGKQTAKMIDLGLFPKSETAHAAEPAKSVPHTTNDKTLLPGSGPATTGSSS